MSSEVIHETILRDAIDLIEDTKNIDIDKLGSARKKSFKSIAHASKNMTLVFPVVFPSDLNINTAMMLSKAIERKAVTMLQILFSAFYFSDTADGLDYLRNFHANLDMGSELSFDNIMDIATSIDNLGESGKIVITDREAIEEVKADLRNINSYLPDNISESGLNEYKIFSAYGNINILNEVRRNNNSPSFVNNPSIKPTFNNNPKFNPTFKNSPIINVQTGSRGSTSTEKDLVDIMHKRAGANKDQVISSDIKKANELVPTLMTVNFYAKPDGNMEAVHIDSMIIGVKAKLYPIDSEDIVNHVITKYKDNNFFFNFIKATTREISFWKDFVFAIDKAKIDALSNSRKSSSSKMWKVLERRSKKSKIRRLLGSSNSAIAITTLVISTNEVEYLKKYENIDVENPSIMRPIMESYNLMGVCIVDEAVETAQFLFDTGDDTYETISFDGLEKESDANGYKKMINLITKIAR